MRSFLARNIKIVAPLAVAVLALGVYLAIGVFGIHTLFIDDKVDEAGPVFVSGAGAVEDPPADGSETGEPVTAAPETAEPEAIEVAEDPEAAAEPAEAAPEIVTVVDGTFIDRSHPAEGRALVLNDGTAQRFLRFEDFATDNGPDLNVYLSSAPPDADAAAFDDDFVDLGDLKGNVGSQNYEIPEDVDLDRYRTVVIWCVRFGVAFGAAELV